MYPCSPAVPPDVAPCDPSSCYDDPNQALRTMCSCVDWQGDPIPGCSPRMPNFPIMIYECRNASTGETRSLSASACTQLGEPWRVSPCYCCCHGGYGAARVATSAGPVALGALAVGDAVLAAHGATDPGGVIAWHPTTVTFATAALPPTEGAAPLMINIGFGADQSLIFHPGQLVLTPGGKLRRADQLVAGSDALVGAEGAALAVHSVTPGYYRGEIAYVATGGSGPADWDGSLDGHLLALDGVIVGDYLLELMADSDQLAPHLAAAPGAQALATTATTATAPPRVAASATFAALAGPSIIIPAAAIELFSPAQEAAFAAGRVPVRAVTDQTNVARVHYFITLFSAFFPQVTVTLDWGSHRVNVSAFATATRAQVVIGGGFARLGPIYAEAIAVAIGFGIANRTIRSDATSVGHALSDGVGMILPQALQGGDLATTLSAALDQYQALFALVAPPADGTTGVQAPTPVPPPQKPTLTLACFAEVIDAAISGVDFPACAS